MYAAKMKRDRVLRDKSFDEERLKREYEEFKEK
jgi:hypothetical protein